MIFKKLSDYFVLSNRKNGKKMIEIAQVKSDSMHTSILFVCLDNFVSELMLGSQSVKCSDICQHLIQVPNTF